ncbi:hypothetical protein [Pseudooceanicola aestuarii]|uniref:hypothetical protein n=1 Tax=Pseudooceanicola aestuarii TaxID=2697319 RepID=UPI0013D4E757|nr:hypothetical protein [Pseudooceanicola aestuarii]
MTLTIRPADRDATFVFATDPEADVLAPLREAPPLNGRASATVAEVLGLSDLTPDAVEVVHPADLAGLGLSGYLTDGLGLQEDAVARDRARLDALSAPVVLLQGSAAGTRDLTLDPPRTLQFIGRYPAARGNSTMEPLVSDSARDRLATTPAPPAPAPRRRGWTAAVVLGTAVLLAILATIYAIVQ